MIADLFRLPVLISLGYQYHDSILLELQMEVVDRHRPSQRAIFNNNDAYYAKMKKDLEELRFTVLHWAVYLVNLYLSLT
jgi:hypothetical protein